MSYALDSSLLHALHRASQSADEAFAQEQIASGLTPRQFALLAALQDHEGESQRRLVDSSGIDRSTLADIARRLQKKGLLTRKRTRRDARANALRLTDEGRRYLQEAAVVLARTEARLMAYFDNGQRQDLLQCLKAIVTAASAAPSHGASNVSAPADAAGSADGAKGAGILMTASTMTRTLNGGTPRSPRRKLGSIRRSALMNWRADRSTT
jgi:DNA-binding MarR family transcriptional regulator